jgi:aminoglycoside phosphotransferase (APT) family kinase protein
VIPTTPDELTETWLATILTRHGFSAAVEAIEFQRLGASSLTSVLLRVVPRFQDETTGVTPALLWKRSADDANHRELFRAGYAAEVGFYREVAPGLDVSVPRCFAAAYEEERGAHVLLLEDLTSGTHGDFVQGVSPEGAESVLREFARLHAARWIRPMLPAGLADHPQGARPFVTEHASLSTAYLAEHVDGHAAERTRRYGDEVAGLRASLAAGPQAFTHGDAHPANVILPRAAGARPSLVDWQCSGAGAPILDVARFLVLALTIEDRRRFEQVLLSSYLKEVETRSGHYDTGAATRDYRMASVLQWGWAVELVRHESMWDWDTREAMPTLVRRVAAAFDDATTELDSR